MATGSAPPPRRSAGTVRLLLAEKLPDVEEEPGTGRVTRSHGTLPDPQWTTPFLGRPSRRRAQTGPAAPHSLQSQLDAVKAAGQDFPPSVDPSAAASSVMVTLEPVPTAATAPALSPQASQRKKSQRSVRQRWVNVLREMFWDLARRSDKRGRTLDRETFLKYFPLPGVLGERLFDLFDTDKSQTIDFHEFFLGLSVIYNGTPEDRKKFLFDMYDLDGNGFITRAELSALLAHVPAALKVLQNMGAEPAAARPVSQLAYSPSLDYSEEESLSQSGEPTLLSDFEEESRLQPEEEAPPEELDQAVDTLVDTILSRVERPSARADGLTFEEFCEVADKSAELSEVFNLFFDVGMPDLPVPSDTLVPEFILERGGPACFCGGDIGGAVGRHFIRFARPALRHTVPSPAPLAPPAQPPESPKGRPEPPGTPSALRTPHVFPRLPTDTMEPDEDISATGRIDSMQTESAREVVVSGWLYKYGRRFNMKHYRFFVLRDRFLYYFTKTQNAAPKKAIFLQGAKALAVCNTGTRKREVFAFDLVLPSGKVLRLYARDRRDRDLWVNTITRASRAARFHDDYIIHEPLGRGHFAVVHRGQSRHTRRPVAIKIVQKNGTSKEDIGLLRNEVAALTLLRHPNIVRLVDVYDTPEFLYLVTEWVPSGDVWRLTRQLGDHVTHPCVCSVWAAYRAKSSSNDHRLTDPRHPVTVTSQLVAERLALVVARGTLRGLSCLHRHNVVHRDLKPENILMVTASRAARGPTDDVTCRCQSCSVCTALGTLLDVKITDFGLARILPPAVRAREPLGTLSYAAPEVILQRPYLGEVDIWAVGVLTYQILSGGQQLPFTGATEEDLAAAIIAGVFEFRPSDRWEGIPPEAKDFVRTLVRTTPSARPSTRGALDHPWLVGRYPRVIGS